MSRTVVHRRPFTRAIISHVTALSGELVGDGQAPDFSGDPTYPYSVVTGAEDGQRNGPISDGQADVGQRIQISTFGITPEQAEALADRIHDLMINQPLPNIDGRRVLLVDLIDGGQTLRDDTVQPPLFFCPQIFELLTTPII